MTGFCLGPRPAPTRPQVARRSKHRTPRLRPTPAGVSKLKPANTNSIPPKQHAALSKHLAESELELRSLSLNDKAESESSDEDTHSLGYKDGWVNSHFYPPPLIFPISSPPSHWENPKPTESCMKDGKFVLPTRPPQHNRRAPLSRSYGPTKRTPRVKSSAKRTASTPCSTSTESTASRALPSSGFFPTPFEAADITSTACTTSASSSTCTLPSKVPSPSGSVFSPIPFMTVCEGTSLPDSIDTRTSSRSWGFLPVEEESVLRQRYPYGYPILCSFGYNGVSGLGAKEDGIRTPICLYWGDQRSKEGVFCAEDYEVQGGEDGESW